MTRKQHSFQYDVVVLGATGYTGKLTAQHIAQHLPSDLKWALAGRTASKLQAVVDDVKKINADRLAPSIEIANVDDDGQLQELVKKTYLLITTVGPYSAYGEHAFKACAKSGTHYLDVTGEIPWVARMIKRYEADAKASGAIMVPQTGIESAPSDLATWAMVKHIRETMGTKTRDVNISIHALRSTPSGGTLASAIQIFDHFSTAELRETSKPYSLSPVPRTGLTRPPRSTMAKIFGVRTVPGLGYVTTSVAEMADTPIVERTWGLLSELPTRKKEFYGPRFRFAQHFRAVNWLHGVIVHWGLLVGAVLLACFPFVRSLVKRFVYQQGQGPPLELAKKDKIEYRGVATPDTVGPTNKREVYCRAWFEGSMYYLSGLLLAEAARTILEDDLELDGGIYTPACLGQGFIDRADAAGFHMVVQTLE